MGVVYAAFDRERNIRLALKTLLRATPDTIYRFKREFRSLAEVSHPNLVTLYEMISVDGQWLFTMELVDGDQLLHYLRTDEPPDDQTDEPTATATDQQPSDDSTMKLPAGETHGQQRAGHLLHNPDHGRIRQAFLQLVDGIEALHRTGHTHRDIKPSNIMVDQDGRVVILDFGVLAPQRGYFETRDKDAVIGTPAYMSPEQMRGAHETSPASDWYSLGLVLYEALTGRKPFTGGPSRVLAAKEAEKFIPPRDLVPTTPNALDALCRGLLRTDPAARPTVMAMREMLGGDIEGALSIPVGFDRANSLLVGREPHLDTLRGAFDEVQKGNRVTVFVHGESGMGKTALIDAFLGEIQANDAVVLAGRCYERESVPYKAVDTVIDALSAHLERLPKDVTTELLPTDIHALCRLFPVLERVEAITELPPRLRDWPDPHELRRRAFTALRELLSALAQLRPLVLFIDDLQWGDQDSAVLIADVLHPPHEPALLFLGCYRTNEADTSPMLKALFRRESRLGPAAQVRKLPVVALDEPSVHKLVRRLHSEWCVSVDSDLLATAIAREAAGSPYFIRELVSFAQRHPDMLEAGQASEQLTLEVVLRDRIAGLDDDVRQLLQLIAAAAKPVPRRLVRDALTGEAGPSRVDPFKLLSDRHFIRTRTTGTTELVEPYHDRIRETVYSWLSPARRIELHRGLAESFERHGHTDYQALAKHYEIAGENRRAQEYFIKAADESSAKFAFEIAADMYSRAVDLGKPTGSALASMRGKIADCLANAGQGAEAAVAYTDAVAALGQRDDDADKTYRELKLYCQLRAAEEWLRSGHIDEGRKALDTALAFVGLPSPKRPLRDLLLLRARIRLRGFRYKPDPDVTLSLEDRMRVELCWSAAAAFGMTDHIRGAIFQCRHLTEALRLRHDSSIAQGLGLEAIMRSLAGLHTQKAVHRIAQTATEIAQRAGDPQSIAIATAAWGLAEFQFGHWQLAREKCERSLVLLREQCTRVWFQIYSIELYALWALGWQGELKEMGRRVAMLLREAEGRGDRYVTATLCTGLPALRWLVEDRPQRALTEMRAAMEHWSAGGYHLQHFWACLCEVNTALYTGDVEAAWARIDNQWPPMKRSLLFRLHLVRLDGLWMRGRAAMAMAASTQGNVRDRFVKEAISMAKRLGRERPPFARAMASSLRAGIATIRDRPEDCVRFLQQAAAQFDLAEMRANAAIVRRALGARLTGEQGKQTHDNAGQLLRDQGVVDLKRFGRVFLPGLAR